MCEMCGHAAKPLPGVQVLIFPSSIYARETYEKLCYEDYTRMRSTAAIAQADNRTASSKDSV